MELIINESKAVGIKYLKMSVAVRYDEEDMPNDFPFRNGNLWNVLIDIDEHRIIEWPKGVSHELFMKICDEGCYYLMDSDRNIIKSKEQEYVPNNLLPGEYGDYLDFVIDESGYITNWLDDANFRDFDDE